ncbi:golgin subfamily A member 5-like [Gossypium australe]|uniref:Golgin subfamily A member 5-like n=1 Tax=Gossypium australe TaxID=47621 RepID=A0A5B6UZK2_9ROSI|nr:golgin subfamily A member 5-like [Gossypium australe]
MVPDEILHRCRDLDWVPLLEIWGPVGYAPLLVLRQYRSRQFIPTTQGLAQCKFSYKGDNYKKKIREMSNAWNQTRRIKRFTIGLTTTLEYNGWWGKRVNGNIPRPMVPSELKIINQDFERRNSELGKRIEQLEEEKMQLGLDVDVQKLEANKIRKGKNKAEEDLGSLKTDYKKLRLLMRTVGLGKTSEQWRQEINEEKNKA